MDHCYCNELFEQIRSEGRAEGEAKGELKGKIDVLLMILDHRGVELRESTIKWIRTCPMPAVVDGWIRRAMTETTADDILYC